MGASQSTEQEPPVSTKGYHILRVSPNSPAENAGLEPFFDYLVGAQGVVLEDDAAYLSSTVRENVGNEIMLHVYNSKQGVIRDIVVVPSDTWQGYTPAQGLLGISARYCDFEEATSRVWHILSVLPNSPAEIAGLRPYKDFIIGTPAQTLREQFDLYEVVDKYIGRSLMLYVYNEDFDNVREVMIVPNRDWGGEGSLGCDIGYGILHRIPNRPPKPYNLSNDAGDVNNATGYNVHGNPNPQSNMPTVNVDAEYLDSTGTEEHNGTTGNLHDHKHDHEHHHNHDHNHNHEHHHHEHEHSHNHNHNHNHDHDHTHEEQATQEAPKEDESLQDRSQVPIPQSSTEPNAIPTPISEAAPTSPEKSPINIEDDSDSLR